MCFRFLTTGIHIKTLRKRISYGLILRKILGYCKVLLNSPKINICDIVIQLMVNRLRHQ